MKDSLTGLWNRLKADARQDNMIGRAPVNQFNHAKRLADASFRTVVTPNVDTVYSQAWLDIGAEPMIFVLPETVNVTLPDVGKQHMLRVKNGVVLVYENALSDAADVSITCPKDALFAILTRQQETVARTVRVEGDADLLTLMMESMNQFPINGTNPFNIIEP